MDASHGPPLPSDVANLQGMVRELLATVADLRKAVEAQQHRTDDLTRQLYGRKSERVRDGTTAPLPPQPIDKGLPGPGLLAHVVVSKFADHLPLHRRHGILARHGVDLAPSTLGGWVAAAADLLRPLVGRMAELVRQSRVIQTD